MTATLHPISTPVVQQAQPEFIRLPKTGEHCHWCGLGRSQLNALIKDGTIKSISLRKQNHKRGTRLIVLETVLKYIRGFDTNANAKKTEAAAHA